MLTFTHRAEDALATFHAAAVRWNPDVCLRLARSGTQLQPQMVEGPEPGDEQRSVGALTVYVEPGLDGTVDAGDHNILTLVSG